MQMTGGRAERLHWNENGTALDNMATNRFKSLCGSEDPCKRCCPDASFQLQLKCSFHESECRSLAMSEGEGGSEGGDVRLLFFFQAVILKLLLWQDNGRWECINISRGPLRARTCHAKFNSVMLLL